MNATPPRPTTTTSTTPTSTTAPASITASEFEQIDYSYVEAVAPGLRGNEVGDQEKTSNGRGKTIPDPDFRYLPTYSRPIRRPNTSNGNVITEDSGLIAPLY
jgi:hypothetical protein